MRAGGFHRHGFNDFDESRFTITEISYTKYLTFPDWKVVNEHYPRNILLVRCTVTVIPQNGNTPLILAAKSGMADVVRRLLQEHADPNVRNERGISPLMMAAREGHAEIAQMLMGAGADKRLRNKKRETAADIAATAGHDEISKLLEKAARTVVDARHGKQQDQEFPHY